MLDALNKIFNDETVEVRKNEYFDLLQKAAIIKAIENLYDTGEPVRTWQIKALLGRKDLEIGNDDV